MLPPYQVFQMGLQLAVTIHAEKSYSINLKSDSIYHFPIDLEPNGRPFVFKSIGNGKYNLISG